MAAFTRRALLAAAGTVAAAAAARKPHAEELHDLSDLALTTPPAPVPALSFTDADGKTLTLDDYKGQGVVLNLWATWCVPCVQELPSLDALARRLAGDGVAVLALSSDRGGASAVRRFYDQHDIRTLAPLLDPKMAAAHAVNVRGIPTTLLIDRDGRERARFEGSADWAADDAVAKVRSLIGAAPRPHTDAI